MLDCFITLASGASQATADYVRDLLLLLTAAALVSIIAPRTRLPSIPGYLLIGAVIGSSMLGLIRSDENVRQISDLAIILLMFTIGLHLDTDSIRSGMVSILLVGIFSTLASALVVWPVGLAFGLAAPVALTIGLAFAMSSTAVVLGLLNQRREIHRVHGRLCVGIALTQDMLAIPVLALLPALAVWAGKARAGASQAPINPDGLGPTLELLRNGALKIAAICGIIFFGRWILPRALREASKNSNTEALLIVATTAALAAAVATYQLGIGSALGAFLAGFMLSATPFRHQLAGQLSPMRDLFMAVFFTAVGINMNVRIALESWWIVAIGVGAVLTMKSLVIGGATWGGGATASVAALTGLLLCQAGEFSLVVLGEAAQLQLIDERTMSILIAIVVLSLIVTTPLYGLGRKLEPQLVRVPLARWITNPALHEPGGHGASAAHGGSPDDPFKDDPLPYPHRPVIIAGFGVVGRNLAEHFGAAGIPYIVVELNPNTVIKQQKLGRSFYFGDISNPDVLESAGVRAAEAVVLTIPDDEAVLRACRTIRSISPSVFIAARTTYLSRAIAATEMGADYVCVEEVVTAQDMAKQVMERLARRAVGA